MLSTCNQQLASAYSMIECVRFRYGTSIAIVLPTHINKPAIASICFPASYGMARTQDIPDERELSQPQPTKRLVSYEVECISLVRYISMLATCEWKEFHNRCKREMPHEHYSGG